MGRLRCFLSVLCVLLAAVVGLALSPIHPGWAVRLTRYVSRSMLGGKRRAKVKKTPGRGRGRGPVSVPGRLPRPVRHMAGNRAQADQGLVRGNLQTLPDPQPRDYREAVQEEVQSALVNLGMHRTEARRLAAEASQGRNFDSAIRWAIGRAA